jgi:predicted NUDIX family NTP pyrophosphohydrolase
VLEQPKSKRSNVSSGLLLFRENSGSLQMLLAHPGGPIWEKRDEGAWTIPKGLVNEGENVLAAACREFEEETGLKPAGPYIPLGFIKQKAGKVVHAWAWEGSADESKMKSNWMKMEWPYKSGQWIQFPEIDRCAWFNPTESKKKINPAQIAFIDSLEEWWMRRRVSN